MNRLLLLLFGAVSLVAHAQVPDYVPTEGLVGWYPFNGNANDESGNEQNGEIFGTQPTIDRFGFSESAYSFEHTRIEIENSATNDQFKTISFWFMSSSPAGNQVAFKQNVFVGHGYERVSCSIQWNGTHFAGKEVCNAGWQYDNVGGDLNDGSWHHYVGILDSAQKRLYIDGTLLDESDFNPENMCSGGDLIIGQEWDGVPYDFIGNLDDFGFWNRVLTEEEILALYNAEPPVPGCTDVNACNFNEEANEDDGSCSYPAFGLADCEAGGALCGEGTIWDASIQACVGFNDCPSDLDGDGIVGVSDLLSLLSDFGTECPPDLAEWTCGDPVNYHGYDYATVQIGEQCWFAENLRYLPNVNAVSAGSEDELGTYCYVYGYDGNDVDEAASTENYLNYGALYNFHAFSEQNICPADFHVPSQEEWDELIQFTGGAELSGFQLKASGADGPSWNGINAYGFSALPSGIRRSNVGGENDWFELGTSTTFWTSTIDIYPSQARGKSLHNNFDWIQDWGHDIDNGLPVRCIEDSE